MTPLEKTIAYGVLVVIALVAFAAVFLAVVNVLYERDVRKRERERERACRHRQLREDEAIAAAKRQLIGRPVQVVISGSMEEALTGVAPARSFAEGGRVPRLGRGPV